MAIFKKKEKLETWSVLVPEDKWTLAAMLLRDDFGKDHIIVDRLKETVDGKEKLYAEVHFYSDMNEYLKVMVALDKKGCQVITPGETKEEKKQ